MRSGENNPMFGKKHTTATRKKMSEARSGENNPMFGKKHNETALKKMSEVLTGKKHSVETRKKMSESKSGENNPNYKHGKYRTKEYVCATGAKRRAAKKNQTPELTEIEQNKIHFIYELAATMADVHIDHYQPLSKGGLHHPDNLQILDTKLNLEKKDKWPLSIDEQKKYRGLRI